MLDSKEKEHFIQFVSELKPVYLIKDDLLSRLFKGDFLKQFTCLKKLDKNHIITIMNKTNVYQDLSQEKALFTLHIYLLKTFKLNSEGFNILKILLQALSLSLRNDE